jgi:hypothetical protein
MIFCSSRDPEMNRRFGSILAICLLLVSAASAQNNALPLTRRAYSNPPLGFERNLGQADGGIVFLARGRGYALSLKGSDAVLSFAEKSERVSSRSDLGTRRLTGEDAPADPRSSVVIRLRHGQGPLTATGEDELPGSVNYIFGNSPATWLTGIPTYARVRYSHVYPGIDLVYYGKQQQLEFDFDLAPGANPGQIQMQFGGAGPVELDGDGNLKIAAGDTYLALGKPVAYQDTDGKRREIPGRFRRIDRHTVGFAFGRYDHTLPLVIDPILTYSTYLGAASNGSANAVAVDAAGNAYVTGLHTS